MTNLAYEVQRAELFAKLVPEYDAAQAKLDELYRSMPAFDRFYRDQQGLADIEVKVPTGSRMNPLLRAHHAYKGSRNENRVRCRLYEYYTALRGPDLQRDCLGDLKWMLVYSLREWGGFDIAWGTKPKTVLVDPRAINTRTFAVYQGMVSAALARCDTWLALRTVQDRLKHAKQLKLPLNSLCNDFRSLWEPYNLHGAVLGHVSNHVRVAYAAVGWMIGARDAKGKLLGLHDELSPVKLDGTNNHFDAPGFTAHMRTKWLRSYKEGTSKCNEIFGKVDNIKSALRDHEHKMEKEVFQN